ncbi:MAG: formylglycine-generating enzyme family protein [Chloroflexi bacterium]|nr:formylglycine-generating enzyme family protein [Chloroflexota bacterium]
MYEIAYEVHKGHDDKSKRSDDTGSLVTEGLVLGILHDQLQDTQKENTFLEYCQKANGLLMLRGRVKPTGADTERNIYTFPHLTFEEYLASRHLKKLDSGDVRNLLDGSHDRWREAVKFMAEFLCFSKDPDRNAMNGLLEALTTPFPAKLQEKDWRALWLAGELLVLYRRAFSKESVFEEDIIANLHRLVEIAPLSMRERADAADVLDQLWQPNDLYQFISIPSISYPLSVAKYPVTNAQYERFLKPEIFSKDGKKYWLDFPKFDEESQPINKETWGAEGWDWLQGALKDEDYLSENGVLYPRSWRDPRFGIARRNAPVVGISWHEANAYCKWLAQNWKGLPEAESISSFSLPNSSFSFRLPTEAEWVAAAGGDENDRYAWDKGSKVTSKVEDIVRCANVDESGIGRTTPVWMYPQGESPHHVMDMSGNVWEWQANYSGNEYGGEKALALRGGSWGYRRVGARVSVRDNVLPNNRNISFGFRVAAFPR